MTIKKLFEVLEDGTPPLDEEFEEMTEDELMINLPKFTVQKLADIIITNRYIGLYSKLSAAAMKELADRRIAGDTFEYENYIDSNLKDLPKINLDIKNLNSLFSLVKSVSKK